MLAGELGALTHERGPAGRAPGRRTPGPTEPAAVDSSAKRTLVKSAPELWQIADDPARLEAWMGSLIGSAEPVGVEVISRDAGRRLICRSVDSPRALLELELIERGLGTSVCVCARGERPLAGGMLEAVIDELGALERRPFSGG